MLVRILLIFSAIHVVVSYVPLATRSHVGLAPMVNVNRRIALDSTTTKNPETFTKTSDPIYDPKAWESGYTTCAKEVCEVVATDLPKDLEGTYYRNGHAKFEAGKEKIMHPFDGDGMVTAVTFKDGSAQFRNRFVRTKVYKMEKKARKVMVRGAFGTPKSGGFLANFLNLAVRDTANTNVVYWGKRLLALFESSRPHIMEPDALRTLRQTTMNGLLQSSQPFSAHPRIDANTNRLINFSSVQNGGKTSDMTVFEFDTDFNCVKQRSFTVDGFVFFHDFVVTKNYYIFTKLPVDFEPLPFILGMQSPAECINYRKDGDCEVIIVPRDDTKEIDYVKVDPHFNFHYANAHEDEAGNIVFDTVRCADMVLAAGKRVEPAWVNIDYGNLVPYSRLERYTLEKEEQGSHRWQFTRKLLSNTQLDFPSVNPKVVGKKNRYVFATAGCDPNKSAPPQGLIKLDLQQGTETKWTPPPHEFIGEVVFASKKNAAADADEDDGYLLSYLWDGLAKEAFLVVFDAKDVTKGPISRIILPTNVPYGLHGCFVPDLTFDEDEVKQKFTAFSALDGKNWNEMKGGFSGIGISYDLGI